jgi:hypothetical protein
MLSERTKRDILVSWGSSAIAVTACSPLEVLKMNAQVTSSNTSIRHMVKDIFQTHSIRGFYKGLRVSLFAQPGYWMFYLPIYNSLKPKYENEDGSLDVHKRMGIVFGASLAASVAVNPLFVYKTRFQTSVLKKNPDGTLKHPKLSYRDMGKDILKQEGVRGFYKGNFVAQIKNTQMVPQWFLYEFFNSHPLNPLENNNIPILDRSFMSGVAAKTIASCIIYYPIDCIRTNIRDNVKNKTILQVTKEIYHRPGGILNFYRGVGIYWLSAVPTFGTIMYVYDKIQKLYE